MLAAIARRFPSDGAEIGHFVSPAQRVDWFRDRRIRSFTHRTGPTMDVVETPIDKLGLYA